MLMYVPWLKPSLRYSHVSLVPSVLPSPTKAQTSRTKVPTPRLKRVETSRRNQKMKKPTEEVNTKIESSRRETANESPKEVVKSGRVVSPVVPFEPDTSRNEKKYKVSTSLSLFSNLLMYIRK
ncbi:hypothetical protein RR48_00325 [Papilio machaon]|uniref:Uncharacterized protein n=1 Tax=Papilio machaon TaxID=76193 RepID=A0A0N1PIS8_PAPMA|nr:hypothetical protein RR48_00325 [Papilio machaon]